MGLAFRIEMHLVMRLVFTQLKRPDNGAIDKAHAFFLRQPCQFVLEYAAIKLVAGRRQHPARAKFCDLVQVLATVREEKAKTEFLQLRAVKMRFEPQHLLKVVRANFDR